MEYSVITYNQLLKYSYVCINMYNIFCSSMYKDNKKKDNIIKNKKDKVIFTLSLFFLKIHVI